MGRGMLSLCLKCKHINHFNFGIGMAFPMVYEKAIKEARIGDFGEEWKQYTQNPHIAIDAGYKLYLCECGAWKMDKDLSLYEPLKSSDSIDNDNTSYVVPSDLQSHYRCIKHYIHKCNECGKVYVLLNEYFRYLYQQEIITKNPMANVEMIKKANFMSAQGKENLPPTDTITVLSEEEIEKFKAEAFSVFGNGKRKYQQAAAYILMLNTGMRTEEALGLLNSDIDLDNRVMHIQRGVKEVSKRDGVTAESGREVIVGKLKSATSRRDVPLNDTAIEMIKDLRKEFYFGEDSPLIPDEHGEVTRPVNFRKRFYRILKAAGIETKGLHSLRHTFATRLINGTKDKDGNIKSLTPCQVADLLGHTTSEITELYYVKRDMKLLNGITDGFEL